MPFITEEIWQAIYEGHPPLKSIALAAYPLPDEQQVRSNRRNRNGHPAGSDRERAKCSRRTKVEPKVKVPDRNLLA